MVVIAILILMMLLITSVIVIVINNNKDATNTFYQLYDKVVIIDPGHGGIDGGAVGRNTGVLESKVNLDIAFKLKRYLEEAGCIVIMTRNKDIGLYNNSGTVRKRKNEDLRNRKKIFDNSKANLVVSIHLNSFPQGKYYGAQTFYPQRSDNSKSAAENIQDSLVRTLDNNNKRKASLKRDVYILKNVKTPTVIVECGFLSNAREEKLLIQDGYQDKIAWAIYVGLMEHFNDK